MNKKRIYNSFELTFSIQYEIYRIEWKITVSQHPHSFKRSYSFQIDHIIIFPTLYAVMSVRIFKS